MIIIARVFASCNRDPVLVTSSPTYQALLSRTLEPPDHDKIECGADCDKHSKYIAPNVSYTHFPSKIKQYGLNLCSNNHSLVSWFFSIVT